MDKEMTLQEFLRLITDEEQRCELEVDKEDDTEYDYLSFWLSDFRQEMSIAYNCKDYIVTGFRIECKSELFIQVKNVK